MKEFKFEDGSKAIFEVIPEGFSIILQAKHLGNNEVKITSTKVVLNNDELTELVNWIGVTLLGGNHD